MKMFRSFTKTLLLLLIACILLLFNALHQLQASTITTAAIAGIGEELITTTRGSTSKLSEEQCNVILDRFDAIYNEKRRVRQENVVLRNQNNNNTTPKQFFDMYEPEANCFTDERFGKKFFEFTNVRERVRDNLKEKYDQIERYDAYGDGPKFICGADVIQPPDCLIYNVGSNNDVSFEMTIHKLIGSAGNNINNNRHHCEVHTFDPTIRRPFWKKGYIGGEYSDFHLWGLGEDNVTQRFRGVTWKGMSIKTIMKELNHFKKRTIDILKIDCEGCEWKVLPKMFDEIIAGEIRVNQIQVEAHHSVGGKELVTGETRDLFFRKLDEAKFRIFHKERNHWGCNGWKCLEYAFVSEEFLRKANKAAVCGY